jgi:cobalt-zinc-cadmium efflux system membrane fusion protein
MTIHPDKRSLFTFAALLVLASIASAHEGHQPLPTKGVQVDIKTGHLTLSRAARDLLDVQSVEVQPKAVTGAIRTYVTTMAPWDDHAFITSRLGGRIASLNVRPGDRVTKGQVVAELDSLALQTLRFDYQKARNDIELSGKLLASLKLAAVSGAVPGQRVSEAENTHQQNQNALDVLRAKAIGLGIAEKALETPLSSEATPLRLPLLSPIAGVVVHADVAVGKFVEPNEHLFEIVDAARVWLRIGVLEQDLKQVSQGQQVLARFNVLPGRTFETHVASPGMWLDPVTHQTTAWAEIRNVAGAPQLLPGMNGQAELVLPGNGANITVPASSIFSDGLDRYVFVEETSTKASSEYRKKSVGLGRRSRDLVEIVSGDVFPGDRVVTRGGHELSSLFFLGVLRLSPESARAIGLKVEAAQSRSVETILRVDGTVELPPQRRTSASPQLPGTLQVIRVVQGQRVRAGDVLAEVASLELQDMQLEYLKATLDGVLWRDTWTRLAGASEAIAKRTLLELESRVKSLETQVASSREKLLTVGLTTQQIDEISQSKRVIASFPVRAPMDGVVVRFDRVLGQVVRADEPLFEIHDPSKAWVQAFVGERDANRIRVGQDARVRFVAGPENEVPGKVARTGPVVGEESRTQAVWIELTHKPELQLKHNMLTSVSLALERPPEVLAVPLGAVVHDGLRNLIFVQKDDGTFERRRVELGRSDDRFIEIRRGLVAGENIATSGVSQLQTAFAGLR